MLLLTVSCDAEVTTFDGVVCFGFGFDTLE